MGMSTHVVGIVPPNEEWRKMRAVYDACVAAGVPVPDSVMEYFGHESPDPKGVTVDLDREECTKEWKDDYRSGFEVHVDKLPKKIKIIRFYNSW